MRAFLGGKTSSMENSLIVLRKVSDWMIKLFVFYIRLLWITVIFRKIVHVWVMLLCLRNGFLNFFIIMSSKLSIKLTINSALFHSY